jgi:hypothetical protein
MQRRGVANAGSHNMILLKPLFFFFCQRYPIVKGIFNSIIGITFSEGVVPLAKKKGKKKQAKKKKPFHHIITPFNWSLGR